MPLTAPAIRGYAQTADVAAFLGVTFTPAQELACAAVIARAEDWVDQETNRTWLSGPVVDEPALYAPFGLDPPSAPSGYGAGWVPMGASLYVSRIPVQSVEAVRSTPYLGVPPVTLLRDLEYEVRDLATGLIRLIVPSGAYKITIDYTPRNFCPGDITQATIEIAATWLIPNLQPDAWLVDSIKLPDLQVTYSKASNSVAVPPSVSAILDRYRIRSVA